MKIKTLLSTILLSSVLVLAACGDTDEEVEVGKETEVEETEVVDSTEEKTDEVVEEEIEEEIEEEVEEVGFSHLTVSVDEYSDNVREALQVLNDLNKYQTEEDLEGLLSTIPAVQREETAERLERFFEAVDYEIAEDVHEIVTDEDGEVVLRSIKEVTIIDEEFGTEIHRNDVLHSFAKEDGVYVVDSLNESHTQIQ